MFDVVASLFQHGFMQRALLVGLLVSLCAALLGVSLVLKRYSMIGDGLSHVGFASLSIALALNLAPLMVSIPLVVAAAFLLLRLSEQSRIKGDAMVALISTSALTVGVIVASLSGSNVDVSSYLFGSILAVGESDMYLSVALSIAVLVVFALFYHRIFAVTFDESFAQATGTNANAFNTLIALLSAITIVIGMRMMGTLLISSLVIFPALTAMRVFKSFQSVVLCSAALSMFCMLMGLVISMAISIPAGASVVAMNMAMFLVFSLIRMMKRT